MKWFKITEYTPPIDVIVIVRRTNGSYDILKHNGNQWYDDTFFPNEDGFVTHFLIPDPIEEKRLLPERWIFNFPADGRHFCTRCRKDFSGSEISTHADGCL